jgi:hypothetical protein
MKLSAIVIVANVVLFFIPVVIHIAIVLLVAGRLKNLEEYISSDKKRTPKNKKGSRCPLYILINNSIFAVYYVRCNLKAIVSYLIIWFSYHPVYKNEYCLLLNCYLCGQNCMQIN